MEFEGLDELEKMRILSPTGKRPPVPEVGILSDEGVAKSASAATPRPSFEAAILEGSR